MADRSAAPLRFEGETARMGGMRRERVGDAYEIVLESGVRFVARRRRDAGRGWVLTTPWGGLLGLFDSLDDCEARIEADLARGAAWTREK